MYKPHFFYVSSQAVPFSPHLIAVWDVTCGAGHFYARTEYDKSYYPQEMLSLIRVASGEGVMETVSGRFALAEGSLLLLPAHDIVSYTAVSDVWVYHWYNFTLPEAPPIFTIGAVYPLAVNEEENLNLQSMFLHQTGGDPASNTLVNALFTLQYFTWIQRLENRQIERSPYRVQMQQVLHELHLHISEPISIGRLAEKAGLSERQFRAVFTKLYGRSPKAYQQHLRLRSGAAQLKSTDAPIGEIAEMLGYYSQFQFSRDFKKAFGVSPSGYRAQGRREAQENR